MRRFISLFSFVFVVLVTACGNTAREPVSIPAFVDELERGDIVFAHGRYLVVREVMPERQCVITRNILSLAELGEFCGSNRANLEKVIKRDSPEEWQALVLDVWI